MVVGTVRCLIEWVLLGVVVLLLLLLLLLLVHRTELILLVEVRRWH